MSASRMPALSPIACNPSARLTAVVDLPTPPLPEATAIMCLMPGTWMVCRAPAGGRHRRRRRRSRRGAALRARACCTLALSGRPPLRQPRPLPPPRDASAVSTATTPVTPGMSRTTFSAACRNGSSSEARCGGTVMENETRPSFSRISDTSPRSTMLPSQVRPFDLTQPLEDLFLAEAHAMLSWKLVQAALLLAAADEVTTPTATLAHSGRGFTVCHATARL